MRARGRRLLLFTGSCGLIGLTALTGCGSSGNSSSGPAAISTPTEALDTGQAGVGRTGDISVPKGSYTRVSGGVSLRLDISNSGATPDRLIKAVSDVSGAGALVPNPISIPARGTVHVGSGPVSITLPVSASLDPGETLAVTLTFANSGQLLVYALTSS